ncbi:MAG: UDP-glucose/GDP-mannose dehydrogenase family protein [Planctomycetes bacterium]|nr:UDP-glucose/GDP-mannose dehydrogenase family protein [Planctomycetota bacterium]
MRLCIIGCGYVGLVTGTCFAEMGNNVVAVDKDARRVEMLCGGSVPIHEPGLAELAKTNQAAGRLQFSTDLAAGVDSAQIIFICVGTPPAPDGATDLSAVVAVSRAIAASMKEPKLIVVKSTVPAGTCARITEEISSLTDTAFEVASNPEFLKEGVAIDDFLRPDRVVVGAESPAARETLRRLYAPFLRTGKPFMAMATASAEMTKHASNAMLAARISFINEVAALSEAVGADVEEIRRGMAADTRIGSSFLFPGVGFGGSCFPKDLRSLAHLGRTNGVEMFSSEAATTMNRLARERFLQRIAAHFDNDLDGRRLAFWGLAFKPRTDDVREAPAVWIIDAILAKWPAADIRAHDPQAIDRARQVLPETVQFSASNYDILEGADALVISTEWNEFRSPDFHEIKRLMKSPVIFDGRNIYDPGMLAEMGFTYYCVGRPTVRPE